MSAGRVLSIHITPKHGAPTVAVSHVHAIPGKGLEGDRHFNPEGTPADGSDEEITLIEAEAIEALQTEQGIRLEPGESRRNLVTQGVHLNDLVGRTFRVGQVTLRGVTLCHPCAHLASLTSRQVLEGLLNRGGLRAQILNEGTIHTGDAIVLE